MKLLQERPQMRAVIFDLDGLLIDSEPYWEKADAAFFQKYGKEYTSDINKKIMGMGQREILEYYKQSYGFVGVTEELIHERRRLLYQLLLRDIVLMEGTKALLTQLYSNFLLAIATSGHTFERIQEILRKLEIDYFFSILVSGDEVEHSKPAPDIYLATAKKLHVDPKDCIVLEDAPNGVKAGKAAGMTVVGVNKDEEIYKKLKEAGADFLVSSLKEVSL